MCGRYASSGAPRTSSRSSRSSTSRVAGAARARLQRGADQRGVRRRGAAARRDGEPRRAARAPAAGADLGAGAVLGQGPSIGNRMINARMETVAEKPAYRRAFAARRCLLRPTATSSGTPPQRVDDGRQAAQAAVLHPPQGRRRAGDGRALRDLARPDARTTTTPTGSAGPARCSPPRPRTPSATSTTGCR